MEEEAQQREEEKEEKEKEEEEKEEEKEEENNNNNNNNNMPLHEIRSAGTDVFVGVVVILSAFAIVLTGIGIAGIAMMTACHNCGLKIR